MIDKVNGNIYPFEVNGSKLLPEIPVEKRKYYGRIYNYLKLVGQTRGNTRRNRRKEKKQRQQKRRADKRAEDEKLRDRAGMRQERSELRAISGHSKIPYS